MSGMIVVKHVAGSTLKGLEQRFEQTCVRIGRNPDNDIVFDQAGDPLVSGRHAELQVNADQVHVQDVGSRNGTFLNGQPVTSPAVVRPGDVVSLAENGAQFCVEFSAPRQLFVNDSQKSRGEEKRFIGQATLQRAIRLAVKEERRRISGTLIAWGLVIVLLAAGAGGIYYVNTAALRRDQEQLRQKQSALSDAAQKLERLNELDRLQELDHLAARQTQLEQGHKRLDAEVTAAQKAMATLRAQTDCAIETELSRYEKELKQLKGKISSGEADIARLVVELQQRDQAIGKLQRDQSLSQEQRRQLIAETEQQIANLQSELRQAESSQRQRTGHEQTWDDLVDRYMPSIFLCVAVDPDKKIGPITGTAFVIREDGLLATNAHVVKLLDGLPVRYVVQNVTGKRFEIRRLVAHPSHENVQSPDVGLIQLDASDRKFRPLPLADRASLERLRIGTHLGTLGYPGELSEKYFSHFDKAQNRFKTAIATFKDGWVGRITNFSLEQDEFERMTLIQHSASTTKGTSGSPMFTLDGKVVAVNAGVFAFSYDITVEQEGKAQTHRLSTASPAEIAYAIRIDVLLDYLQRVGW